MSAYEVGETHIAVLVAAGFEQRPKSDVRFSWRRGEEWVEVTADTACDVADMLTRMNYAAVDYRYRREGVENPGEYPEYYRLRRLEQVMTVVIDGGGLSPVAVLRAIDGYEHQCDGHPTWEGSEAQEYCRRLRLWVIQILPGYSEAPWHVTDPAKVSRRALERA